jgi:hypothetical protein
MTRVLTVRPSAVNQLTLPCADLQTIINAAKPPARTQVDWHTGLCECYAEPGGCSFCFLATACPCIAYGMNYSLLVSRDPCNLQACLGPCCLFAVIELATAEMGLEHKNRLHGDGFTYMISHHRFEVGKNIGLYTDSNFSTLLSIWCDTLWCAPCVQAQIRNEAMHQSQNAAFRFRAARNHCNACAFCCCAYDCGCAGCLEPLTNI